MKPTYEIEEILPSGMKYTEETSRAVRSLPMRDCFLWQPGVDEPVSGLNITRFQQRFGTVAVAAEGIGGVETLPGFRRQGLMSTLLKRSMTEIARRVPVAFIADAIEGMYEAFGFVNCLSESHLSLRVQHVDRANGGPLDSASQRVRRFTHEDLPEMVRLYNDTHQLRPWTHVRLAGWNRLHETQTWQPGSAVIVLEKAGRLAGYAVFTEHFFGHTLERFIVDELTAVDGPAARALLAEIASQCWQMRMGEFWVREPLDSAAGIAAQRLGCTHHQTFPPSGGMMGAILDREKLLLQLEPELQRRLPNRVSLEAHPAAFDALCSGAIIPDNAVLLRLLVGHWSLTQARAAGTSIPEPFMPVFESWFPGGGTRLLPQPYSHNLDRY